jgi:16S rRNA (guanine527-N7)-methyltransferase
VISSEAEARAFVAQRCDGEALFRLDRLVELLKAENKRQNLVSAGSLDSVWQRHIADSIQLLDYVPRGTAPWLDLGTGAGFPGVVIAVARPASQVVLVESRKRRIEWLEGVVADLGLSRCRIEGARLEVVAPFASAVISARAFAPLDKTLALARRFSTSDTVWLLPKGRSAAQEVANLPKSLQTMFHVEQSVTDADSGIVVGRIAKERCE